MYNPVSTYRIQFNKDFTFADFEKIIPYLQKLGVKTVYASPVFEATPGSVHGYDGVDPNAINPEIGTEEQLCGLSKKLQEIGIGWLQDIVPNHMAFHSNNEWFMDVLEKGRQSEFAGFFDLIWTGRLYQGRIMVPFLGARLTEVLEKKEISLAIHDGRYALKYYESFYPLRPKSYATVLHFLEIQDEEIFSRLENIEDEVDFAEKWEILRKKILDELEKNSIEEKLSSINQDSHKLHEIIDEQFYQLCHWQETDHQINFRRFFTVNSLICLNIHRPEVFQQYHALIKKLVEERIFSGLRVDHIDGLYDPTNYLEQLRELAGEEIFVVVEKILEPGESLPEHWPIQGNTGYDFLSMVNNLLTNKNSEEKFSQFYHELTGDTKSIHEHLHEKKSHILYQHMGGELENLFQLFMRSELVTEGDYAQMRTEDIKTAIAEFLICCPVYRFYGNNFPLDETEEKSVENIFSRILKGRTDLEKSVGLLRKILLEKPHESDEVYNTRVLRFYQRCMQFTGPLMAKGVEDTLMYTYSRFIGHNDVGDSPEAFGCEKEKFHEMMIERQKKWPLSLNATSTHDTKRGEDVRARLNVLTDIPDEWFARVNEWREMNAELRQNGAPDANDEYFIYQNLIGAYPMPGTEENFSERFEQYIEKALREAKTHSNWTSPNTDYENAAKNFAKNLLDTNRPFWKNFSQFHKKISDYGIINSLSQIILRFTCPGTPDTYQGTELWDLSLVDPDNRRAVNYLLREKFLSEVSQENFSSELWDDRYSGRIKLWLLHKLLQLRKENSELFANGEYIPLKAKGEFAENIFSFARRFEEKILVVAIPLHIAEMCEKQQKEIFSLDWVETKITLPENSQGWRNIFTGRKIEGREFSVQKLFSEFPFTIFTPDC